MGAGEQGPFICAPCSLYGFCKQFISVVNKRLDDGVSERDRTTDRQADSQTDGQTDRQTGRQRELEGNNVRKG